MATPQRGDLQSLPSAGSNGTHEPVEAKQEYIFFNFDAECLGWTEGDKAPEETQLDTPSSPRPWSESGWDFRSPAPSKALFTPEHAVSEKIEASEEAPSAALLSMDGYCNLEPEIPMEESWLHFNSFAFCCDYSLQLLEVHVLLTEAPNVDDQAVANHGPESESEVEPKDDTLGVPVEPAPKRRRSATPPSVVVPPEAVDTDQARSGPFFFLINIACLNPMPQLLPERISPPSPHSGNTLGSGSPPTHRQTARRPSLRNVRSASESTPTLGTRSLRRKGFPNPV